MRILGLFLVFSLSAPLLAAEPTLVDAAHDSVVMRALPVPDMASLAVQQSVEEGPMPIWNAHPDSPQEWEKFVAGLASAVDKGVPRLAAQQGVTIKAMNLGGVRVFELTPAQIAPRNRNRVLLHLHGGGYVLNPGLSGTPEAILMAAAGGIKVVSVDYRMPPRDPYPAAMDDALAVYRTLLKSLPAKKIGVFGTSTGGGMTLALVMRARAAGLPIPGAIAAGTPWSDMTGTGDSYHTNEYVDNVLVSNSGWLGDAARLYANGHDLKDPQLSPVYGDFRHFPPTLLTTGTRDLFLSNTVRVHRKLRDAGIAADLMVFEGLSHAQYLMLPASPESHAYFDELNKFFVRHLAR